MRRRFAGLLALCLMTTGCPRPPSPTVSSSATSADFLLRDVTSDSGLTYRWEIAGKRPLNILQTIGNGCAFLDYNNDGNLDILLVGPKPALYKGDGKGRFTEVTSSALGDLSGHFLGVAVGDIDNDGFDDLYFSGYREGRLLRNDGGKRFVDITKASGLKPQPWGTSASFADLDRDGFLDLYIGNYVVFGPNTQPQLCQSEGLLTACGPRNYSPEFGGLYRNVSGTGFIESSRAFGATPVAGKCLGVAIGPIDRAGTMAIALANDEMPGDLLVSRAPHRLENQGQASGTAYDRSGNLHAGMGIDWGDIDNDGALDLVVTTFYNENKCLYRNDGKGTFEERSAALGLGSARPLVAFGVKFADFDNDGFLDLTIANGHVQDNIHAINAQTYRQPTQLFLNDTGRRFIDAGDRLSPDARAPIVGRGLATGDYDNDGRIDVLVVDAEGAPKLLHNEGKNERHWIGFALSQPTGAAGGRNAYGALVTLRAGGRTLVRHCHTDGSYLSASDPRVHFGLGDTATIESVSVRWPGGTTDTYRNLAADRYHRLAPEQAR